MRIERRSYDLTFKTEACALVARGDRSITEVAEGLGVPMGTLWNWYNRGMAKKGKSKPTAPAAARAAQEETAEQKSDRLERENAELRKKIQQLETDRAILKKAAAFFAKENE